MFRFAFLLICVSILSSRASIFGIGEGLVQNGQRMISSIKTLGNVFHPPKTPENVATTEKHGELTKEIWQLIDVDDSSAEGMP